MRAADQPRSTPSLAIPQTQNTAPVLEFNCLYTHDVRRKQKRWQDGFLRFHTFNRRIMVYDVPRNFVGDTHWNAEHLHDGDEVTLDKDGVCVQVADEVGRTETDLTELRKSKRPAPNVTKPSSPFRGAALPARSFTSGQPTVQLKHRSLNALLGTPRGRIGKALISDKSPFEERLEAENHPWNATRPAKRQRMNEASTPRAETTRTVTTARSPRQAMRTLPAPADQLPSTNEVIDLISSPEHHSRDLARFPNRTLLSSSPSHMRHYANLTAVVDSSSPAFQRQNTPESDATGRKPNDRHRPDSRQARGTRGLGSNQPTEPASNDRHGTAIDCRAFNTEERAASAHRHTQNAHHTMQRQTPDMDSQRELSASKSGKTLRVAASEPKKKKLLCQNQLGMSRHRRPSLAAQDTAASRSGPACKAVVSKHFETVPQRRQLEQRLARVGKNSEERSINASREGHDVVAPEQEGSFQQARRSAPELPLQNHLLLPTAMPDANSGELSPAVPEPRIQTDVAMSAQTHASEDLVQETSRNVAACSNPQSRKTPGRAVGTVNETSTGILNRKFQTPRPPDIKAAMSEGNANPWTREAFDLLTWRPPGWDEETWCMRQRS